MTGEQLLFSVLRSFLCHTPVSTAPTFEEFEAASRLAHRHDLAHFVYHVLECQGLLPAPADETQAAFLTQAQRKVFKTQYHYTRFEAELHRIAEALTAAQIPFIPMKGALLNTLYPEPWTRTRCDLDILVKPEHLDRAAAAITALGYTGNDTREYHNLSLICNDVHLELHYTIMERHADMDALLEQVWEHTTADGYRQVETPAFFRFHHMAHMAHHFLGGGCGIRTVMDLWLLCQAPDHDETAVCALCEQAGLLGFYHSMCRLADIWFGDGEHDETTRCWQAFIVKGGTYGTEEQRQASVSASYGKWEMAKRLLFIPYRDLKNLYPSLDGKRWLTPAYQLGHTVRRLAQGRGAHAVTRIRRAGSQDGTVKATRELFDSVNLR